MADIKTVEIKIDVEHPSKSEVYINNKIVQNLVGISISANVNEEPAEIEFHTNGTSLGIGEKGWSFFIKPHCPACGYDGKRFHESSIRENTDLPEIQSD